MLIRLVRMTFRPDELETFLAHFERSAPHIRAFPGCCHLELWHAAGTPEAVTTYSLWADADALEAYRQSDLFRSTWARVKPLFAEAPVARSHHRMRGPVAPARDR